MRLFVFPAVLLCASALLAQTGVRRAPSFMLPDSYNQFHDLLDYRGKVVIVEIMRTDCPECKPFSKKLEQLKTYYGGKVGILSISNPPDSPDTVKAFIREMGITYPILFDCGQVSYSYVRPNPLRPAINIPHIYLVDGAGLIRGDFEYGPPTTEIFLGSGLYKEIDALLKAAPAPAKPAAQPASKK